MNGNRWFWGLLVLLLACYTLLSGLIPPSDDEIYYWCWAKQLQLSYFDHPPLTAYLIRASITVFGDHVWAIRFPACLASVVVLGVLGHLMRGHWLWPMLLLSPLFNLGAILMTPDTPLLLCWSLYLLWVVKAQESLANTIPISRSEGLPLFQWLLGGVILGCGGLGKYPMILAVPCSAVAFLLSGVPIRRWMLGFVIHGVLAFTLVIPVFVFNWETDFAPFRFQWEHATCVEQSGGIVTLLEFLGIQVLLMGWLPVLLLPVVWLRWRSWIHDPRLRVSGLLYLLPFTFFLYQAFKKPLEGNWGLACYLGFWPLAAAWIGEWANRPWRKWLVASLFAIPAGASMMMAIHLVEPLPLIKPHSDRLTRQSEKMKVFAKASQILSVQPEDLPVYTPLYQSTALLQFHGVAAWQLDGISRPSHFTMPPHLLTEVDRAYVFNEGPLMPDQAIGFGPPEVIANIPLVVRGEVYTVYQILRYTRVAQTVKSP